MSQNERIKLFVGCAPNGEDAESQMVLEYTARKHSSLPIDIVWMKINPDKELKIECEEAYTYDVQKRVPDVSKAKEILGLMLLSLHNIHFYLNLMKNIREAINNKDFDKFEKIFLENYYSGDIESI